MTWPSSTTARVTAKMSSFGGDAVQNVYHLVKTAGSTADADAADAVGEYLEDVYTELLSFLSDECNFVSYNIFILDNDNALGDFPWPTLTVGSETGDQMPASSAGLILMRTGVSRHVGRKYMGPFTETNHDAGAWSASLLAALLDCADVIATPFTASNGVAFTPVVLDVVSGQERSITEVAADQRVRSQRRRNRGIGV